MRGTKRPAKSVEKDGKKGAKRKKVSGSGALTVKDIINDRLTPLANAYWALGGKKLRAYDAKVIEQVYKTELSGEDFKKLQSRAVLLEFSSYLENYLWKNFNPEKATFAHVMSIVMMVNEKFREGVPIWDIFHVQNEKYIESFFDMVFQLGSMKEMTIIEKISQVLFLINCYSSLEDPKIRTCCTKYLSLPMWRHLSKSRFNECIGQSATLEAAWDLLPKKAATPVEKMRTDFFPMLIKDFLSVLDQKTLDKHSQKYAERCMELFVDLLSRLPTRRFFRPLLVDCQFIVRCRLSASFQRPQGKLIRQLLDMIQFYEAYGIDDQEGKALTEKEVEVRRYEDIEHLQGLAFKYFRKELKSLTLAPASSMDTRKGILKHLEKLSIKRLRELCEKVQILGSKSDESFLPVPETKKFLSEILVATYERRKSQRQEISALPLYPSEEVLWDMNLVPELEYHGNEVLALPKLNLQFLTIYDYLLRNFNLFRLESTYEIREDIKNVVHRLKPRIAGNGETIFTGWAKMAVPIKEFNVTKVKKPNIGEMKPAEVLAEITVDLSPFQTNVREDWEKIRKHDVLFLLCVEAKYELNDKPKKMSMKARMDPKELGIKYVRGCEVKLVLDEEKSMIGERRKDGTLYEGTGDLRTYKVEMDTAQYQMDMTALIDGKDDVNTTFNLLVKRKAKENNFKAVLGTIRDLMAGQFIIPDWLHDIFLGYGDPGSATFMSVKSPTYKLRFADSFLDYKHLKSCFPNQKLEIKGQSKKPSPPYELEFLDQKLVVEGTEESKKGKLNGSSDLNKLKVSPYPFEEPGPYPEDQPKRNSIRFTAKQVEAIRSGLNHGLTMIVGPPGTGKTDVAVQIMSELFHNNPKQRTLLVTHSNHALNDLFEKIMQRDIDERYLLRCGRGEEELKTDKDFSKFGRVNYMLQRRLHCLREIARLAKSLGLPDDAGYTCETAAHFYLQHVLSRWEVFISQWKTYQKTGTVPEDMVRYAAITREKKVKESIEEMEEDEEKEDEKKEEVPQIQMQEEKDKNFVEKFFPFGDFFSNAPNEVFTGDEKIDYDKAWGCWRHLKKLFTELEECRPFEILRNYKDRGNYLISKHAKVIAMTCTHAAIRRGEFVNLHLQYDNLIMEEAAQILEIETFIPMLLQEHDKEFGCRLKRVVLLGDHHQLPPIIKNMAFQKYSHMDQSLFARFIRLGTPHIQLNAQGRSRPSIAKLWNWRYKELGDLPHVLKEKMYLKANAGFSYEYQFIDVPEFQGKGETSPMPYFYQNLAEAEYIVQVYMYMRLLGYPAHTISLLTTYNGQKALLEDIISMRCRNNPFYGAPARISTVDKYQGQQNDYVLLSLVRTNSAGHIRDVRRLVVAMSRARFGLYVFGRKDLFKNCFELTPTFNVLLKRPTKLCLNVKELSSLTERRVKKTGEIFEVKDMVHMGKIVSQMAQKAQQNLSQMEYLEKQRQERARKEEEAIQKAELEKKRKEYAAIEAAESVQPMAEEGENSEVTQGTVPAEKSVEMKTAETVEEKAASTEDDKDDAKMEIDESSGSKMVTKAQPEKAGESSTAAKADSEDSAKSGEMNKSSSTAAKADSKDSAKSGEMKKSISEPVSMETEKETPQEEPMPDYDSMSFRQLQQSCKKRGLPARGKKVELIKKLKAAWGK